VANILRMALYEFKSFIKDKSAVFWTIAWPILWVFMVAYVFMPVGGAHMTLRVAVIDNDEGLPPSNASWSIPYLNMTVKKNFTSLLMDAFNRLNGSNGTIYKVKVLKNTCNGNFSGCLSVAKELLVDRGFDVAVIVPENASKSLAMWAPVRIALLVKGAMPTETYMRYGSIMSVLGNLMTNLSMRRADAAAHMVTSFYSRFSGTANSSGTRWNYTNANISLKTMERYIKYFFYSIAFPLYPKLDTVRPPTTADRAGQIGWVSVGAVGMSLMTGLLTAGAGFFIYRKSNGVLKRVLSSPATLLELLGGDLLSAIAITALSATVILGTGIAIGGRIVFNALNPGHYLAVALIFVAGIFAYGLGLLIAPTVRSTHATGAATAIGLMLVFLTGIWWPPKEMLPTPLQAFANVFPPACAFEAVRDLLVWGKGVAQTYWNIVIAVTGTLTLYAVIALIYRGRAEKIAEKLL